VYVRFQGFFIYTATRRNEVSNEQERIRRHMQRGGGTNHMIVKYDTITRNKVRWQRPRSDRSFVRDDDRATSQGIDTNEVTALQRVISKSRSKVVPRSRCRSEAISDVFAHAFYNVDFIRIRKARVISK